MPFQNGETALIVAASHGHKEVVQVLLKFNANILIISKKVNHILSIIVNVPLLYKVLY